MTLFCDTACGYSALGMCLHYETNTYKVQNPTYSVVSTEPVFHL